MIVIKRVTVSVSDDYDNKDEPSDKIVVKKKKYDGSKNTKNKVVRMTRIICIYRFSIWIKT